jgi:DNA-directed RNA polymerase omega subunit
MLVHVAAGRVRQLQEGAQYLVDSPRNEDIVIALREIAGGKVRISGKESSGREEKRTVATAEPHKEEVVQEQEPKAVQELTAAKNTTLEEPMPKKETVTDVGIARKYLKTRNVCKVKFMLPQNVAPDANSVCIVGDFNDWDTHANPMKKLGNGNYSITLELKPKKEYQFRYLIDGARWENDWNADKYAKSPFGDSENSVVVI